MPRWKHYGPIVCGQPSGHEGRHGGPFLWWHDPPLLTIGGRASR